MGEGHISKVLQAHGYEVISTDLIYRGFGDPEPLDFLKKMLVVLTLVLLLMAVAEYFSIDPVWFLIVWYLSDNISA